MSLFKSTDWEQEATKHRELLVQMMANQQAKLVQAQQLAKSIEGGFTSAIRSQGLMEKRIQEYFSLLSALLAQESKVQSELAHLRDALGRKPRKN